MTNKERFLTARIDEDLFYEFKIEAIKRKLTVQNAVIEAVKLYLENGEKNGMV